MTLQCLSVMGHGGATITHFNHDNEEREERRGETERDVKGNLRRRGGGGAMRLLVFQPPVSKLQGKADPTS